MKNLATIAVFFVLGTAAFAKPVPAMNERPAARLADVDIKLEVAARTPEQNYFQAPPAQFNAGGLPCRLPLVVFDKTRLASSCR